MSPAAGEPLATHLPAIKVDWRERLRAEPAHSPLGRVDTLECLIDATLLQLAVGLAVGEREHWLKRNQPLIGSVHQHCGCAVPPLLRYYLAGEQALVSVLLEHLPQGAREAAELLRAISRHELQSLCGQCPRAGMPGCLRHCRPPPN